MTDQTLTSDAGAEPVVTTDAPEVAASAEAPPRRTQDQAVRDALEAVGALEPQGLKKPNVADRERNDTGQFKAADAAKPDAPKKPAAPEAAAAAKDDKPAAPEKPAPEKADTPAPTAKPKIAPPERFNDGARAAWDAAPDEVKHEVTRMQHELEKGIGEYRAKVAESEAREAPLKPYREMAEKAGVKFEDALGNYVAAEKALIENPVQALARMAQSYVPGGLEAFVAHLTGKQSGQTTPENAIMAEIKAENIKLQRQIEQLSQGFQQQTAEQRAAQEAAVLRGALTAVEPQMPRLDELRGDMQLLIEMGRVSGATPQEVYLQAYREADRLNPVAPEPAPPAAAAHTREPATSISGAPARGSSPRPPMPRSQQEAVDGALRKFGLI